MICTAEGCELPRAYGRRLFCEAHYYRLRRGSGSGPIVKKERHGLSDSVEYRAWGAMWSRCTNPKASHFSHYGARGIKICDRWRSFLAFFSDMGEKPRPDLSLERIDNEKGYYPGNCKWATRSEQMLNRRKPSR